MTQYQYEGMNRFMGAYRGAQEMDQSRARRQAGNALAGNDVQGAMTALGGVGDLQSVQALQQGQERQAQAMQEQEDEAKKEAQSFMLQGGLGLMQAPYESRQQLYIEVLRPTLEQMGLPPEYLAQLDQTDKSDQNLQAWITALGGELPQRPGGMNVGGGRIVERDPYTGEYREVYAAPAQPMTAPAGYRLTPDGNLEFIPGGPADPRVAGARSAATRAPRRSGGGGSSRGGGGGGNAAPSGGSRPWERFR